MDRKYKRQLELGIVALGLSTLALLWLVLAIGFWQLATCDCNSQNVITPRPAEAWDTRPVIGHCLNNPDVEIFACIEDSPKPSQASEYRLQMKREDI